MNSKFELEWEWKRVRKCPKYIISHTGYIGNIKTGHTMVMQLQSGYYGTSLINRSGQRKHFSLHILLARHFIPNPKKLRYVDHIDNNPLNNNINNLRWVTNSQNVRSFHDNFKVHRAINQYGIDGEFIKKWISMDEILKIHPTFKSRNIKNCLSGQFLSSHGYKWEYKDPPIKPKIKIDPNEVFESIPEFEDSDLTNYNISNRGNIKNNVDTNALMKSDKGKSGYESIMLDNDKSGKRQRYRIHRLVAYTFVENDDPKNKTVVNHLDGDKSNNYYKNLEWTTSAGNTIHAHGIKINARDPKNGKLYEQFDCIANMNRHLELPVTSQLISKMCRDKTSDKCMFGFKWELVE